MSFDSRMDARWRNVIAPAIRSVTIGGKPLDPHRVDQSQIGDSILIEIMREISSCRLILADITALDELNGRPVRNANALYELGLAHAVRRPEEVVVLRSDRLRLDFDVAANRVREYSPDDEPTGAIAFVASALLEALRTVDLTRQMSVDSVIERLDSMEWGILLASISGPVSRKDPGVLGEFFIRTLESNAIARLLALGLLRSEALQITPENVATQWKAPTTSLFRYSITPFGRAVAAQGQKRLVGPEVALAVKKVQEKGGDVNDVSQIIEALRESASEPPATST